TSLQPPSPASSVGRIPRGGRRRLAYALSWGRREREHMPRRDDDHEDDRERGRILKFPLPPRRAGWVTPEHVDEDEPLAFLRAVVLRHTDPRVADEVVPLLGDPEQQAAVLAALASFVPAAMSAQIVAYRARARTLPADRERTAHEA